MSVARSTGLVVLLTALAASALAQSPPAPPAAPPSAKPAPPPSAKPAAPPSAKPAAPPAAKPAPEAQVMTVEPMHAVVLPMKGSYAQHPEAFARLSGFLSGRGVTASGPIFARYFSDPPVEEANLVWEVGLPVPAGVTAEPPFEIKELPATLTAVHVHRGPLEDLGTAWPALMDWIISNGYQPVGPVTQVFKGDLAAAPEVEMRMPVQNMQK